MVEFDSERVEIIMGKRKMLITSIFLFSPAMFPKSFYPQVFKAFMLILVKG